MLNMVMLIRSAAVNKYNLFFSSCILYFRIKMFYVTSLIFIHFIISILRFSNFIKYLILSTSFLIKQASRKVVRRSSC